VDVESPLLVVKRISSKTGIESYFGFLLEYLS